MTAICAIALDLSIEAGGWPDETDLARLAGTVTEALGQELGLSGASEVSLLFTGDAAMQRLNRDWRGQDKPTNVLSFPAFNIAPGVDLPPMLGDVALGYETVRREAAEEGKPFRDHLAHLLAHGLLHLLGYDHETDEEAEAMEAIERRLLARLAIEDPYL